MEPTTKSHTTKIGNTQALWRLTASHRYRFSAALAALAVGTLLLYVPPQIVRMVIDGVLAPHETSATLAPWIVNVLEWLNAREHVTRSLLLGGAAVVLVTVIGGVFMTVKSALTTLAAERIARSLRLRLYDHLQHAPVTYHDGKPTGDQVQRCTSDVDTVRMLFTSQAVEIARAVALLLIGVPLMFWMDATLAWVAIAVLPVIVTFAVVFFGRVQGSFKAMDDAEGAMTATLQENLTGIRVVRAFARQEYERERFGAKNRVHRELNDRLFRIMALYWSLSDLMAFTQGALVLFVGAHRVSTGQISLGTLVAFLSYMGLYLWPVRQMGRVLTELGKATVAMGRIQEILEATQETDAPAAQPANGDALPDRVNGEVRFENVGLTFGETRVLHGVSVEVPTGSTLALVGPSGSGKSTLMQLLLRFHDCTDGRITLDGHDIAALPRKYLRGQIGVVMQEPFLYSKTLRENIRLGRHTADDSEIVESASIACVHDAIEGFERKYDTLVGERGVTLSGGQRQRVAIARAILRDAPLLILDDALSAVDTHTEAVILDALRARRGRHTTIVIAHRLSTLMHADQIAVIEHGKVVQRGTHAELVEQDGLYRRLWQIQTALEEDLSRELAEEAAPSIARNDEGGNGRPDELMASRR